MEGARSARSFAYGEMIEVDRLVVKWEMRGMYLLRGSGGVEGEYE